MSVPFFCLCCLLPFILLLLPDFEASSPSSIPLPFFLVFPLGQIISFLWLLRSQSPGFPPAALFFISLLCSPCNIRMLQGPVLGLLILHVLRRQTHPFLWPQFLIYRLFQNLFLQPGCFLELQTQMPSCQLDISLCVSHRYFGQKGAPLSSHLKYFLSKFKALLSSPLPNLKPTLFSLTSSHKALLILPSKIRRTSCLFLPPVLLPKTNLIMSGLPSQNFPPTPSSQFPVVLRI